VAKEGYQIKDSDCKCGTHNVKIAHLAHLGCQPCSIE